jgi:two-component system, NarL family, invasion response regulator UvrY
MTKIKVALADDHILLRDALSALINGFEQFTIVGVANNGLQVQQLLQNGQVPDILILDLNMPQMDGYDTAQWMNIHHPAIKILILTMYDSDLALIRLLQHGVRGFLKKDIHPAELQHAMQMVLTNGYYYPHTTSGRMASLFRRTNDGDTVFQKSMLNSVELLFLEKVSTDMTYKEIAAVMNMGTRAIDNLREALFEKLDVRSRVGLAIYAIRNGIVHF